MSSHEEEKVAVTTPKIQFLAFPPQIGSNNGQQVSDSDVSFWDSDCPEESPTTKKQDEVKKRSIAQPAVSKHISQKIQENKD